jgi:hypothetical protein
MTNRELLVALAQGKKMRLSEWAPGAYIYMDDRGNLHNELDHIDVLPLHTSAWQEVVEPLYWEGEVDVDYLHRDAKFCVVVPANFENKRVHIAVKEIVG